MRSKFLACAENVLFVGRMCRVLCPHAQLNGPTRRGRRSESAGGALTMPPSTGKLPSASSVDSGSGAAMPSQPLQASAASDGSAPTATQVDGKENNGSTVDDSQIGSKKRSGDGKPRSKLKLKKPDPPPGTGKI